MDIMESYRESTTVWQLPQILVKTYHHWANLHQAEMVMVTNQHYTQSSWSRR